MTVTTGRTSDRILSEELAGRAVDVSQAEAAMCAVKDLLQYPRSQWPAPASPWEDLVVGLAVSVLRLEGRALMARRQAIESVRRAALRRPAA